MSCRASTTWTPPSRALPAAASTTRWIVSRICGLVPRTRSPRNMTTPSRISSRRCTTPSTGNVSSRWHHLLLHPHRRHRGPRHPQRGRLYLGLQELRRRRDERYGLHRLWLPGYDDQRSGQPGRQLRVRGCPRHRDPPLLQVSEGRKTSTNPMATIFAWSGALRSAASWTASASSWPSRTGSSRRRFPGSRVGR